MLLLPGAVGYLLISCYPLSLNSSHLFTLVPSTTRDSLLYLCREPGSFEYFCKISRPIVIFQMVTLNVILNLQLRTHSKHAYPVSIPMYSLLRIDKRPVRRGLFYVLDANYLDLFWSLFPFEIPLLTFTKEGYLEGHSCVHFPVKLLISESLDKTELWYIWMQYVIDGTNWEYADILWNIRMYKVSLSLTICSWEWQNAMKVQWHHRAAIWMFCVICVWLILEPNY